jgi:hypothetical protein
MQQHPGHYARLLTSGSDPVDLEIMRDLNRTFPNHVFFHQRQGPGQQSLFHVLRAYSAHDRQVRRFICVGQLRVKCVSYAWGICE